MKAEAFASAHGVDADEIAALLRRAAMKAEAFASAHVFGLLWR